MKKEVDVKRKRNRKKLTRIDKIEEALRKLIEEGEKVSKRIKEISEENERGFRELRERVNKTSEEVAKTSEEIRKLKTEISRLTGSWGEFVEGMIEPSSIKFMEEKGFKVIGIYAGAKFSKDGMNAEYDLFLVCEKKSNKNNKKEKVILLVSAKTKVSSKDVDELLEDMKNFFFFLEEYKGYKLMGAIAGIRFGRGADIYALRSGLIVMKPAGEVMQIQEPKKIRFVE
jgi:predicted nuclease with TOPRIM domain